MSTKAKKINGSFFREKSAIAVDPSLPSYEDNKYFQVKLDRAKSFIKKVGLPKKISGK